MKIELLRRNLTAALITAALCVCAFVQIEASGPPLPGDLQQVYAIPPGVTSWFSFQRWGKYPPCPRNWLAGRTDVSYYSSATLGAREIVIDDRSVDYAALALERQTLAAMSGIPENETPDPTPAYGPNDLYLSIQTDTNLAGYVDLFLHGATNGFWQLFSKFDLNPPLGIRYWTPGQFINDNTGTNLVVFDPVFMGTPTEFFRALFGNTVVRILPFHYAQTPTEPCSPTVLGETGVFEVDVNPTVPYDLAVVYTISGSAINGLDYTNISGTLIVPANSSVGNIYIQPLYEAILDFDESVTLTLVPTNGYLIDPVYPAATMLISECPDRLTNLFSVVATNVPTPSGIDYHPPTQKLIIGVNLVSPGSPGSSGEPYNFAALGTNGVLTNWSGVHGIAEERRPLVIKTTANGFTNGDLFFNTDNLGEIGWVSADGTVSNLSWCILTNEQDYVEGSLWVDQTGIWSSNLFAVTSYANTAGGTRGVWRIPSPTNTLQFTRIDTYHLEGLLTLPDDQKYGPWAGKLLTADESKSLVYALDTNGIAQAYPLNGLQADKLMVIPTNQDLYCVAWHDYPDPSLILKLSHTAFTNYVGDILAEQSGEAFAPFAGVYIIHWDPGLTNFVTRSIRVPSAFGGQLEGVIFAPIDIPALPQ